MAVISNTAEPLHEVGRAIFSGFSEILVNSYSSTFGIFRVLNRPHLMPDVRRLERCSYLGEDARALQG